MVNMSFSCRCRQFHFLTLFELCSHSFNIYFALFLSQSDYIAYSLDITILSGCHCDCLCVFLLIHIHSSGFSNMIWPVLLALLQPGLCCSYDVAPHHSLAYMSLFCNECFALNGLFIEYLLDITTSLQVHVPAAQIK